MEKKKFLFFVLALLLGRTSFAQLQDNFSDGDIATNPPWSGDNTLFVVNSGRMKLQAPVISGTAFLTTPSQAIHNASWEFYLQLDFTPSSTNYSKIYLTSDQSNLNAPLNGYFVKAGNTTRDVCLYRQNGTQEIKMIDGTDDRLNLALVKLRIKVTRSATGVWQLYSDVGPIGTYLSEGTTTDTSITSSSFFGIQCVYTSTRSDKFWFDDFLVTGGAIPDTMPPEIINETTTNSRQINLLFSEPLERISAEEVSNYKIQGFGSPVKASLQTDQKTVMLSFDSELNNGINYTLLVSGVADLSANAITSASVGVLYFKSRTPQFKDIIFTEVFPDPSPQIGLPSAEFVEIYNRSEVPFNLAGWELSDGSSKAIFPSQIILPGNYKLVSALSASTLFTSLTNVLGVNNFPTLNNDSDAITLKYNHQTIDSIKYQLSWYRDDDKAEGGWTLELIDINNPCGEENNWAASENPSGGTPGKQNSVFANKPDLTTPKLISVFPETPLTITLVFDEKLLASSIGPEKFLLQPDQKIIGSKFLDQSLRIVQLRLEKEIVIRQRYALHFSGISDCSGNLIEAGDTEFGMPELSDSLDIVVNEILFNPRSGGVDFIEVYNASPKFLDLSAVKLSNFNNGIPSGIAPLFSSRVLLSPGDFAVFTSDPALIQMQYPSGKMEKLMKAALPGLPDDEGSIALLNNDGRILDAVSYSKTWHSPFIKDDSGVSLERINYHEPSGERSNWISASSLNGFATPGYLNSQGRENPGTDDQVQVIPGIFTPGRDPNDFVRIQYYFDQPGWVGNVKICNLQGHVVKEVISNEILGSKGFLRWDGDRTDGSRVRMGYYFVWFEVFDDAGNTITFRKRVIVSSP